MANLSISVVSQSKIYFKGDSRGLHIAMDPSIGEIRGKIRLNFLDTREDKGMIEINFTDPNPHVAVYESDGESIHMGFGTSLTEGVKAGLELTAKQAEEFIKDIQRQLDKKRKTPDKTVVIDGQLYEILPPDPTEVDGFQLRLRLKAEDP